VCADGVAPGAGGGSAPEVGHGPGDCCWLAFIVREGRVVSRGHNQATTLTDVTAHAETQAIRRLSLDWRVVNPSLRADSGPRWGATLDTTVEPCPMCAWAICIAGISGLVIGARFARMSIGYGAGHVAFYESGWPCQVDIACFLVGSVAFSREP
jgi:tRNA(Arg) A34 adenosine deaminase TadA